MVVSIVVVGALTLCVLIRLVCDLIARWVNFQHSLIPELIFYEFKLCHNAMEATKIICYAKGESKVNNSWATRYFLEFRSGCKNSKSILHETEANPTSCTLRKASFAVWFVKNMTSRKASRTAEYCLRLLLYSHNHNQLYKHIIHIHLHMHAEHNDGTIKTSDTVL